MVPNVSSFYNSSLKACRSEKGVVRLGQVDNDTLTLHVPKDPLHLGQKQLPALLGLDVLKTDLAGVVDVGRGHK